MNIYCSHTRDEQSKDHMNEEMCVMKIYKGPTVSIETN